MVTSTRDVSAAWDADTRSEIVTEDIERFDNCSNNMRTRATSCANAPTTRASDMSPSARLRVKEMEASCGEGTRPWIQWKRTQRQSASTGRSESERTTSLPLVFRRQ